jgi:hypothetical protein
MPTGKHISRGWSLVVIAVALVGLPWFFIRLSTRPVVPPARIDAAERAQLDRDHAAYEAYARRCLDPTTIDARELHESCARELDALRKQWKEAR